MECAPHTLGVHVIQQDERPTPLAAAQACQHGQVEGAARRRQVPQVVRLALRAQWLGGGRARLAPWLSLRPGPGPGPRQRQFKVWRPIDQW